MINCSIVFVNILSIELDTAFNFARKGGRVENI
jgi:hypothetical protein